MNRSMQKKLLTANGLLLRRATSTKMGKQIKKCKKMIKDASCATLIKQAKLTSAAS